MFGRVLLIFALSFAPLAMAGELPQSPTSAEPELNGKVLRLDDVVREALAQNPSIAAANHMVEAQRRRVPQAKALSDPTVTVGWMGNITPFSVQEGDPSSYRGVQAMQMIPLGGNRGARAQVAEREVELADTEVEATRRRLTADVKSAFYDYFAATRALSVTERNRDLLRQLADIAQARYRVGKAMQQDVLKSQVEVTMILQRITMLEAQRATSQARLNTLLARPVDDPLPPPENIEPRPLNVPLQKLVEQARTADPELLKAVRTVARNQSTVTVAQKEYVPDLTVGFMYEQRPAMPDMYSMTFGVNIPVFYKSKQREAVRQAEEEVIAAQQGQKHRQNELFFELKQQYLAAKASEQLLTLYAKAVVPQSSLALESSMASYQVGTIDFLSVLSNFGSELNYETEYYRELANYNTALAKIEALTGSDPASVAGIPVSNPAPERNSNHAQ